MLGEEIAPYGSWKSPIEGKDLVAGTVQFQQVIVDNDQIYWLEGRPEEKGRAVCVRYQGNQDLFNSPYSARTTVHEYGGRCLDIVDGTTYFSNFDDQQIYKIEAGGEPVKLTNEPKLRFADFSISPNRLYLYCVIEDHSSAKKVSNSIGRVDLETGAVKVLIEGYDFFAAPRVSPNGQKLAYYAWNFPYMPWDKTDLWVAELGKSGDVDSTKKQTTSSYSSAINPIWSPENTLYFSSDCDGYWTIYDDQNSIIATKNADFGMPPWQFDPKTMAFLRIDGTLYLAAVYVEKATCHLALIDVAKRKLKRCNLPFTYYSQLETRGDKLVCIAASPTESFEIVEIDPKADSYRIISKTRGTKFGSSYISIPELIEFPTTDSLLSYGFFYPPKNSKFKGPDGESPPLIVCSHGGPTANYYPIFNAKVQYWTSRGFGVVEVNYGGSTGFGKAYRDRLLGTWGETDVADCSNAALHLAKLGKVDPNRLAIKGGSAGGYTTLAALTFTDTFKAGASYYGVSDLEMLAQDTHKFESKYLDILIGPYPQAKEKYQKYSPLNHTDKLSCPIILFQGDGDMIVPPNQAESMYKALLKKGIPTSFILYKGEQHGFRQSKNIIHSIESEYYFYCKIFDIPLDSSIPAIEIDNFSEKGDIDVAGDS